MKSGPARRVTPTIVLIRERRLLLAAALGRMGRALEAALAKLREFDADYLRAGAPPLAQQARRALGWRPATRFGCSWSNSQPGCEDVWLDK